MIGALLIAISDVGHEITSKFIHHFGIWVGIAGGAVTHTAGKAMTESNQSPIIAFVLEWGGLVSMVAAGTLVLKHGVDIWISIRKELDRKRAIKQKN